MALFTAQAFCPGVSGVNTKVVAQTNMSNAMAGKFFIPERLGNKCESRTGGSTAATISIGNDASNYRNIMGAGPLASAAVGEYALANITPDTGFPLIDMTNPIKVNVTVATLSTTEVMTFLLLGWLF